MDKMELATELASALDKSGKTKTQVSTEMDTGMMQLNRILNPAKYNVTLNSLEAFAKACGKRLEIKLI